MPREDPVEEDARDAAAPGRRTRLDPGASARDAAEPVPGRQTFAMHEERRWTEPGGGAEPPGEAEPRAAPGPERLGPGLQWQMTRAFDYDMSGVRIWRDSPLATGTTRALAKDGELHFREGAYQPGTEEGVRLIAHELAHVVQQRGGRGERTGSRRELEREADRAAALVARSGTASIALRAPPGVAYAFDDLEEHGEPDLTPEAWAASRSGAALPAELRGRLERTLGTDVDGIRVHTDAASAAVAEALGADAFAAGRDVHFARGRYEPGTPAGDRLIAHEVAHAVQQGMTDAGDPSRLEVGGRSEARERSADTFADAFERGRPMRADRLGPATAPIVARHQREDVSRPTTDQAQHVHDILNPPAPSGPGQWHGIAGGGGLTAAQVRQQQFGDMIAALEADLQRAVDDINRTGPNPGTAQQRALPVADLQGASDAAKAVTDARFGDWVQNAAATVPQRNRVTRPLQTSGAGQNVFDAYDPAQRSRAGFPIDRAAIEDLVGWMVDNVADVRAAYTPFNYDPHRRGAAGAQERQFQRRVIGHMVQHRASDLRTYERFGFARGDASTGRILIGTRVTPMAPLAAQQNESPQQRQQRQTETEDRAFKWETWKIMIHEYIHVLEHPLYTRAHNNNPVLIEGFCEMFTREVLEQGAIARANADAALRQQVEGGVFPLDANLIGTYSTPADYVRNLADADAIARELTPSNPPGSPGGMNACKAAFFQGHVEYIGLTATGQQAQGTPAGSSLAIPSGFADLAALATAVNVPVADIQAANPGVVQAPVPTLLRIPGARNHRVLAAGGRSAPETWVQIADQNGVTEAALRGANPPGSGAHPPIGATLLVPRP